MKRFWALASKKQTTIGSAAGVLALMVLVSRVLGLVRDRLLSSYFAPEELGVYFAAFRIPNVIFELLVMGALTAAFIPVYTKYLADNRERDAERLATVLINLSVIILAIVAIPLFIAAPAISRLLAPGFDETQIVQMSSYTRFILLFQVGPLLIGNVLTGILQSHSLFLVPAAAPVFYNIGIIIGTIALSSVWGLWGPIVGVAIGAVLFAAIQIPLVIRLGYRHTLDIDPKLPGVKEVGRLMGPRTLGLAIAQIDITVDLMLASLLGARMVTIFNFAQHLQQLPVGLFGTTIAQAALPSLSQFAAKDKKEEFIATIHAAIHQILFWVLPASVLFMVLRIPVVRLVFGASRFDWAATVDTGMTLSAFSVSLFAQALIHILARGFYALYDSKTPVGVGIVTVILNSVLSTLFILVFHLPVWSLGLSTSIASIINAVALLYLLDKKMRGIISRVLVVPAIKMGIAAAVTGAALYVPLKLLDQLVFDTTRTFGLLLLTGVSAGLGIVTYFFLSWVLGVTQVYSVLKATRKIQAFRGFFLEPAQEVVNGGVSDKLT
ncbi:murein biosynthesis integral membrane protein MurJ [Patescibacteria group bacterium]|nr:murein biosynthesis integral membrane protein MurJ [Patescibacteria group bacterium]